MPPHSVASLEISVPVSRNRMSRRGCPENQVGFSRHLWSEPGSRKGLRFTAKAAFECRRSGHRPALIVCEPPKNRAPIEMANRARDGAGIFLQSEFSKAGASPTLRRFQGALAQPFTKTLALVVWSKAFIWGDPSA